MRRMGEKRADNYTNKPSGVLLGLMCDGLYKCDLPSDAVAHLKANPVLIPDSVVIGVNNTALHLHRKELLRVRHPLATKEEKTLLAELIVDWFPHLRLIESTVEFLLTDPARIPPLVQRIVLRSVRHHTNYNSKEWAKAFQQMSTDIDFRERNFPLLSLNVNEEKEWITEERVIGRNVSGSEAVETFRDAGMRPSNLREAVKYFEINPEATIQRTIVALGAQWTKSERVYVPAFTWDRGKTCVNVWPLTTLFSGKCSFLVNVRIGGEKVA